MLSKTEEIKVKYPSDKFSVSICVITYNHAPFISRSLDGMLIQETGFPFEIVIGEDSSTDETLKICELYAARYPGKIRLLKKVPNLGVKNNFKRTLNECKGKYTAICEGDDFWTDKYKLQKQVTFLENNPEYALCSTRFTICNEQGVISGDGMDFHFPSGSAGKEILPETLFETWLTKTLTVVYRSALFSVQLIDQYQYFRDAHLFYHVIANKKAYCINFVGGQYNLHAEGIWSNKLLLEKFIINERIYSELFKGNPSDVNLKVNYEAHLRNLIEYRIRLSKNPFTVAIFKEIFRYIRITRHAGFLLLKLKQMWSIRSNSHGINFVSDAGI